MMNVHNLIKLDKYTNTIPLPKLTLMTRSFEPLGSIPHYANWKASIRGNELDEISFEVPKYYNEVLNPIWDDIIDLKIVSVEHGGKYEIQVTYTDDTQTVKSVTGVSLETELGQVALYDFHVNDDLYDEMELEKHPDGIIPTVLYDPTRLDYSLIHRVLKDKAPHWSIKTEKMPEYILVAEDREPEAVNTFQRKFTVDGTSIYDFLTGDVAKEANIVFRFDTDKRELWFEPLLDYYDDQDHHIVNAIGKDTTILVSKRKLGNQITINSNKDSVKNCFRVEGGDDLMTSQLAVVNMTGDNYIYHFADFQLDDMPYELSDALRNYGPWMEIHEDEYYGTNGLYTRFVTANDQLYYLKHSMAPSVSPDPPHETPEAQWQAIKAALDVSQGHKIVGVSLLNYLTSSAFAGATNNVEAIAKIIDADSRYKIEVVKDNNVPTPTYNNSTHIWTGVIRVTRVSDTTQFYPPKVQNPAQYAQYMINIEAAEDTDTDLWYTRQKVDIALAKGEMSRVDAEFTDSTPVSVMEEYFRQWNLTQLKSFSDGYDSCISTIMSGDSYEKRDIAKRLYAVYKTRLDVLNGKMVDGVIVGGIINERQAQVDEQQAIVDALAGYTKEDGTYQKGEMQQFQESMAFISYLQTADPNRTSHPTAYTLSEAEKLYTKYRAYIREDAYQNSNFVSDTYETSTEKLLENAKLLLEDAEKEIKKACVLQRTLSVNMSNLLALPEFEPLYESFELFNYIRIRTDDEILKLRLIGVDYAGDTMEQISVTFSDQIESVDGSISDLQSVLEQAKSIATSYPATTLQASRGSEAQSYVTNIIQNGLDAANTMLKNSDDNEVTITRAGILAKRMDNEGEYGMKQLRIIGNGMYMTEDAWDSVAMAVGEIDFNGSKQYGVIADAIVGKILVGNKLYISNNDNDANASVIIDGNGITITNGVITWGDGTNSVNAPTINDIPNLTTTISTITQDIEQLDERIETYTNDASQDGLPSAGWSTATEKDKHINDIWLNTSASDVTIDGVTYHAGSTYVYTKSGNTYSWVEKNDSTLKKLAESKATIYTAKPSKYKKNDIWYLDTAGTSGNDYPMFKVGTVLVAKQDAPSTSPYYLKTDWEKKDNYTDNSDFTTFQNLVNNSLNTTIIGQDYVISPKIGGGYLHIANPNDDRSVTIDPQEIDPDGDGNIFVITDIYGAPTIRANSQGQAFFDGSIIAESGNIGGWVIFNDVSSKYLRCTVDVIDTPTEYAYTQINLDALNGSITSYYEKDVRGLVEQIKHTTISQGTLVVSGTDYDQSVPSIENSGVTISYDGISGTYKDSYLVNIKSPVRAASSFQVIGLSTFLDDISVSGNLNVKNGILLEGSSTTYYSITLGKTGNWNAGLLRMYGTLSYYGELFYNGSSSNTSYFLNGEGGNRVIQTTAQSSSIKVKKNIANITEEEVNKLNELRVVKFDYKTSESDDQKECGLIAEETINVLPNIVEETNCEESPYGINYLKLVPYLVKQNQMLQEQIKHLERLVRLMDD